MAKVAELPDKKIGRNYYRWTTCSMCGNYRWARLVKGEPRSKICRKCCSPETRAKMSTTHKDEVLLECKITRFSQRQYV